MKRKGENQREWRNSNKVITRLKIILFISFFCYWFDCHNIHNFTDTKQKIDSSHVKVALMLMAQN